MKQEIQPQFLSSHDKRLNGLLPFILKSKRLRFASSAAVSVLIASACSGGEMKKQEEAFPRILPLSGEVFLTQGAHANDDSPTGIKSSLDFAPKEAKNCPPGARVTVDQPAVATISGVITIVGNEKDRNDPNHSIVEIKEETGLRFGTMHLDKMPENIQVGEKINQGDVIGNPSCEVPKGGRTTGVHVHLYARDGKGSFIPINGQEISGWKIAGDQMTKQGEKTRIADTRRCATDTACGGIRNDFSNNLTKALNKAVLGAATGPARSGPISAAVGEKPAGSETPKPNPTPRPTEKPTPTPIVKKETPTSISQEKIPVGWKPFRSINFPYQTSIPSEWIAVSSNFLGKKIDTITTNGDGIITVVSESTEKDITLEEYAENKVAPFMQMFQNSGAQKEKVPISPKIILFMLSLSENGRSRSTPMAFFDAENKNNTTERSIVTFQFNGQYNNFGFVKMIMLLRPRN